MIEILAVIFELICVWLLTRESLWNFLFGTLSTILFFVLFFQEQLYASMIMQVFFLVMIPYGLYEWNKKEDNQKVKSTRNITKKENFIFIFLTILMTYFVGFILDEYTMAINPYWDSLIFGICMTATYLTQVKVLENWIYWLIANSISLLFYGYQGLYGLALLNLIFLYLSVSGWVKWKMNMK